MKHRKTGKKIVFILLALLVILSTFQISSASSGEQSLYIIVDGKKTEIILTTINGNLYVSAQKIYTGIGAKYEWD